MVAVISDSVSDMDLISLLCGSSGTSGDMVEVIGFSIGFSDFCFSALFSVRGSWWNVVPWDGFVPEYFLSVWLRVTGGVWGD